MKKDTPLVSVVIPAYNAEGFICETLGSVVAQTYGNLEVIVVDDGSTDHACERIVAGFGGRVRLIRQENRGPSAARNRGIAAATGAYIAFQDADDLWLPEKIDRQVALMELHPEVSLLFGDMVNFTAEGNEPRTHFEKKGLGPEFFGDQLLVADAFRKIFHNNFIPTPTVIVRRSLLEKTGGFDERFRFSEDYLLWLRCARLGKVAYQQGPLMLRRMHDTNLTRDTAHNVLIRPLVLEQIEREHGDLLKELGIDVRSRYARLFFQIGYYRLYQQKEYDVAGDFLKSFRCRPNLRAGLYALVTAARLGSCAVQIRQALQRRAKVEG